MKLYPRRLNLLNLLEKKSHFLYGPRSVGKTTLVEAQLGDAQVVDLLDQAVAKGYRRGTLKLQEIAKKYPLIVIDEIQKLPELLDEAHRMIHQYRTTFLLTGSSARKLKRQEANLLGGRAWRSELFPLTYDEIQKIQDFDLITYLNTGGLPHIYSQTSYQEELEAYTSLFIKEEVQQEGLTRGVEAFSDFVDMLALTNGEEVSYQSFSSDCGVSANTIKNYFQILKDILLGFELRPFTRTKIRKAVTRSKFYYFDVGVTNSLANRGRIEFKTELFGRAFEQFIIQEIRAYNSYAKAGWKMFYWRSTSRFEVDLILSEMFAIEIKSSDFIQKKHLKGIRALKEEKLIKHYLVVCLEPIKRSVDGAVIYPWEDFLKELWSGALLGGAKGP